ncbi:MAG: T9SS type A sorting domain-containing protein [Bacteroidetes bacterium]|nr:T9SS type A sorting domain-containing protein [Bacteroidota bacterium]
MKPVQRKPHCSGLGAGIRLASGNFTWPGNRIEVSSTLKPALYLALLLIPGFLLITNIAASQPLTGNKTVGTGGSYTTITMAVAALNANGVGEGGVTFLLTDASYTETHPLTITAQGNAASVVIFKPAAGVSPQITLSATATAQWGIKLDGADYIVFDGSNNGTATRDMTYKLGNTHGSVFFLTNSADNNTIRNCIVRSFANDSTADIGILVKGAGCDSTLIMNNHIFNAYEGIDIFAPGSSGFSTGTRILNNLVGDSLEHISTFGIYCANSQILEITGNEIFFIIRDKKSNTPEGIFVPAMLNQVLRIEKNKVHDLYSTCVDGMGGKGIYLMLTDNNPDISVINNMIWHLGTGTSHTLFSTIDTYAPVGIYIYRSSTNITTGTISIRHNSIWLTPDNVHGLNPNMAFAMGMYVGVGIGGTTAGSGVIDFRNNIIRINIGETGSGFNGSEAYGIYSASTTRDPFAPGSLDHNIYDDTGQDYNYAGRFKPLTTGLTFAEWQTATGQDGNSLNQDPGFISVADLHIQDGYYVNGAGLGVLDDIDGNPRSNPPDIGADEYDLTSATGGLNREQPGIGIFPNPSAGCFTITGIPENTTEIKLSDISGNIVLRRILEGHAPVELRCDAISKGLYLLFIVTDTGTTARKVILN